MKDHTLKRFGLNAQQGLIVRVWAFNQGFYNLFLAIGLFFSLFLLYGKHPELGQILASFILLLITAAGAILFVSSPKNYIAALLQSVPALLGFMCVIN